MVDIQVYIPRDEKCTLSDKSPAPSAKSDDVTKEPCITQITSHQKHLVHLIFGKGSLINTYWKVTMLSQKGTV